MNAFYRVRFSYRLAFFFPFIIIIVLHSLSLALLAHEQLIQNGLLDD
jgi:hypothetical protein